MQPIQFTIFKHDLFSKLILRLYQQLDSSTVDTAAYLRINIPLIALLLRTIVDACKPFGSLAPMIIRRSFLMRRKH